MRAETKALYPANWPEIQAWILRRDDHTCQKCRRDVVDLSITLTVHHWDHNPANCHGSNLVTLCQACHLDQERGSVRSFGLLRNEFEALKVGQLWLQGLARPRPKNYGPPWLDTEPAMSPGTSDHARPGIGPGPELACLAGRD